MILISLKAVEHHPDKNINDPEASQRFQEIGTAYEILSDPQTRELYDMHGIEGISGKSPAGPGMDDIFAQFFGGGFGFDFGPGPRRGKGEDSIIPYEVTLGDLYNGKLVKMNMEKDAVCEVCNGSGARGNAKPKPCSTCDGKGWTYVYSQLAPSRIGTSRAQCHDCKGRGEKLREKERCKKCKGEKTVKQKTRQEIFIEKGMTDRQRIVLAGAGDQQVTWDSIWRCFFVLKATPHESFERSGNDLLTKVTITLSEALLGFSRILLTHLDGRGIKVSSPPGKIIKPDESIVIRGEGMPIHKRPDEQGDLYVIISIQMPDEGWLKSVDQKALASLLPPKKAEVEPYPEVVDEARYEESDIVEVRSRSFPASPNFFDHAFPSQFGEGDDNDWEDDEDDDDEFSHYNMGREPECQHQ
ncbi:DnaJ C terminal domain-containing protein [Cyathus striatus]|nr:DnaJ C terminal domain-containing protein [Cyathus striatus]